MLEKNFLDENERITNNPSYCRIKLISIMLYKNYCYNNSNIDSYLTIT